MNPTQALREHLLQLLDGGQAHIDFASAMADLPHPLQGRRPPGVPYSAWQLLEHMRIAQWDILEFTRNPRHVSPPFPGGYWPRHAVPPGRDAWEASVRSFHIDRESMKSMIADRSTDLNAPIPHGSGQTAVRQALLVADHNAYHLGQLVLLRRWLDAA